MMNDKQVQDIFRKAIAMCDESGFHSDILIQHVEYNRRKSAYGICKTHRDCFSTYSIVSVSKYYVEQCNEQQLLETLVHECLHSWAYTVGGKGHKGAWSKAANVMSKKYNMNITRCSNYTNEDGEQILTNNAKIAKYILKCPNCGKIYTQQRMSKCVKHPEWFVCGVCKTTLERIK